MTDQRTDMHGPADEAPHVTNYYAQCKLCGAQWQVQSDDKTDAKGCNFCGAPASAVQVHYEGPR